MGGARRAGTVRVNVEGAAESAAGIIVTKELTVTHPGAYPLIEHERHTAGTLALEIGPGVQCLGDLLHAGLGVGLSAGTGASSAWERSSSRRFSSGVDGSSSTSTQLPGQ